MEAFAKRQEEAAKVEFSEILVPEKMKQLRDTLRQSRMYRAIPSSHDEVFVQLSLQNASQHVVKFSGDMNCSCDCQALMFEGMPCRHIASS